MNTSQARTVPPFPTRFPPAPVLQLRRRTRAVPTPDWAPAADEIPAVQSLLLRQEQALAERERALVEAEARLAERTRDIDELHALLRAREALLASARLRDSGQRGVVTLREAEALHQLKAELDRQELGLREARAAFREREKFLEDSESRLLQKVQEQQERETELDQREEDLRAREAGLGTRRPYDEFRE